MKKSIYFFIKLFSFLLIFMILFALATIAMVRYIWGDVDIAMIIQHISLITTVPLFPYWKEILIGSILFIFLLFISCYYWKYCTPLLLGISCFILFNNVSFVSSNFKNIYEKHYTIPKIVSTAHKNIIVISLESVENMYTWKDVTGGKNLLPNMMNLRNTGIYFKGYNKLEGYTQPTIPSFIATNCGVPRKANFGFHLLKDKRYRYDPDINSYCVSDFLKDYGYKTYFVMGAKLGDEGTNRFLKKHPFTSSIGKEELKKLGYLQLTSTYRIPDSEIFRYVEDTIKNQGTDPFFFYIITSNTHGPKEFIMEPSCKKIFNDGKDSYLCLDGIIFDFIQWSQKQSWYKDTVIYLVGDHLSWGLKAWNEGGLLLENIKNHGRRETYNLILNEKRFINQKIQKEFSQIDFAPTILESAGFKLWPRKLGLGVSLWSKEPTLVERFGQKKLLEYLKKSEGYYDDFFR